MKSRRAWLIGVGVAIAMVIAVHEHDAQRDQIASLRQQLAAVREQRARTAPHGVLPRGAPPPGLRVVERTPEVAPPGPFAPSEPPAEPAASTESWEREARANEAAIDRAFAAEAVDDAWAAPVQLALRDRLAAAAQASSSALGGIECRSSICRIEVVHRDAEGSRRFAEIPLTAPGEPRVFDSLFVAPARPAPQGGFAVTMYLARDGAALVKS